MTTSYNIITIPTIDRRASKLYMLAGILETIYRASRNFSSSSHQSILPFYQFHRHPRMFLLPLKSPSPGPARTGRTSICSRKLSSPNRPAGRLPDPRTNTRAGFADVGRISVVVVLQQRLISRLVLCLVLCRLLPPLHAIEIAVEHRHILLSLRPEYCLGRPLVVVHHAPSSRSDENPRGGGPVAARRPGPTVRRKTSSRRPQCSMPISRTFPDIQNQRF